jgi:hypothetical protein
VTVLSGIEVRYISRFHPLCSAEAAGLNRLHWAFGSDGFHEGKRDHCAMKGNSGKGK